MKGKIIDLIQEKSPDLLQGLDLSTLTDQEVMDLYGRAVDEAHHRHTAQRAACAELLATKLAQSYLPKVTKERIRAAFKDRVFKEEELMETIYEEKDFLAQIAEESGHGQVRLTGQQRIDVGMGTLERAQMAVDKLFGLSGEDMQELLSAKGLDGNSLFVDLRASSAADYKNAPGFRSLQEMYVFFTGDSEIVGRFNRKGLAADLRASMAVTSSTFSYVLGNTLGRRLVQEYRAIDFKEDLLISERKPVRDFRQQEAVLVGGFPDLEDVDPEAADYQEIQGVTDEEATYSVGQKGNILTITRKTIINDDILLIQRLVRGLGRTARRTHAKYVWNFFINNSNCSDGTAWFTSGHGNLGNSALSHATALAAFKILSKMTEKDSDERLGLLSISDVKPNLIGPYDILETIDKVVNEEFYYTGAGDLTTKIPNPLKGKINGHTIPLLTDTNDWAMLLPPSVINHIEMGYLNGREEPEFFVADTPQAEQVFVADKIRHKVRHEYGGTPVDYRGGYKAQVA